MFFFFLSPLFFFLINGGILQQKETILFFFFFFKYNNSILEHKAVDFQLLCPYSTGEKNNGIPSANHSLGSATEGRNNSEFPLLSQGYVVFYVVVIILRI